MTRMFRVAPLLMLLAATLSACPRRQAPATPPTPTPTVNEDSLARERARQDSIANANAMRERARQDSLAREAARLAEERAARERLMTTLTQSVYFDYNESTITDASREALDAKLPILQANPSVRVRITGHADERGGDEYNIALGKRRAASVQRYLTQRGITADRIETASLGEEQPVCSESNESCWTQNRRAEFEATGAEMLVAPRS